MFIMKSIFKNLLIVAASYLVIGLFVWIYYYVTFFSKFDNVPLFNTLIIIFAWPLVKFMIPIR